MAARRWSVAIGRWHRGKVILLWAWGVALILLALDAVRAMPSHSTVGALAGFVLLVFTAAVPIGLSVVTWIWLGDREGESKDS